MNPPLLGEALSLLSAIVWAFAVVLFRKSGETVHPLALNAFKNTLAIVLLIPLVWMLGHVSWQQIPLHIYAVLFVSGAVGIGLGDTFFFHSLNRLGAGLTGIILCLYSPFIITFSYIWLGERLSVIQLFGALLIISAVVLVSEGRRSTDRVIPRYFSGVAFGVLAAASMAAGVVLMKPLLSAYPVIWVAETRLFGGIAALVLVMLASPGRKRIMPSLSDTRNWHYTVAGSFLGAFVSMIIWIGGMKYTQASTAAALNQTTTIFIFVFAGLLLKEPMTVRRTIAIGLAFAGASLVSLFR